MTLQNVRIHRAGVFIQSDATQLSHQDEAFSRHRAAFFTEWVKKKKKNLSHEFTHFHLWIFYVSKDFDLCESGPGQGAEAWVEDWGLMKRSTTVACCVCLPFSPAAWSMERQRGPFYMTKETSETWAHTLEWHDGVHTADCAKKVPMWGDNPPYLKTRICCLFLANSRFGVVENYRRKISNIILISGSKAKLSHNCNDV